MGVPLTFVLREKEAAIMLFSVSPSIEFQNQKYGFLVFIRSSPIVDVVQLIVPYEK